MPHTSVACLRLLCTLFIFLAPLPVHAKTLVTDTVWEGTIELADDLLVPAGITLIIKPGTTVLVATAESTKTDPEYLSPLTEITVRGRLLANGTSQHPIRFIAKDRQLPGSWAGILLDGGDIALSHASVGTADTGLYLFSGSARLSNCTLQGNQTGIVASGATSKLTIDQTLIAENDYGLVQLSSPQVTRTALTFSGNRKGNERQAAFGVFPPVASPAEAPLPVAKEVSDTALLGDTIWSGRIVITGQIRVPEGSRLVIAPGSVIEFKRKDTNGDGLGENGLLIQGTLIAKGTAARPITFRSAETVRRTGDWDAVNIMNSDGVRNLLEHCRFEDAYRGLHFHFAHVLVSNATFRNNYRAIQFQESNVEIVDSTFIANRSGVQGRDSKLRFSGNRLLGNLTGVNFFRCALTFTDNALLANFREGGRIREGSADIQRNQAIGNRIGLQIADLFRGAIAGNDLSGNTDNGLIMKNVDNLEISGNHLGGNGINGLNLQEVRATIRNNLLTGNRQRGIGIISFNGAITGNTFADNGLYAIENEGSDEVDARENWWGVATPASVIKDGATDPRRGKLMSANPLSTAPLFTWPLAQIYADTLWAGRITLPERATLRQGATLTIKPGTLVTVGPASGLTVYGRLLANGSKEQRITFTASGKQEASSWDEIILENAIDSQFTFTDIEYATWGIHSHFTNLVVNDVGLRNNYGGIRFRSGPVQIRRARVTGNTIGIRSYLGMGDINDSVISDNYTGIFVREKGGSLNIHGNVLTNNSNYNIRIGDFNTEDVPAERNWWGDGDPGETIFDSRQEPGIGRVLYEPYLTKPPVAGGAGK